LQNPEFAASAPVPSCTDKIVTIVLLLCVGSLCGSIAKYLGEKNCIPCACAFWVIGAMAGVVMLVLFFETECGTKVDMQHGATLQVGEGSKHPLLVGLVAALALIALLAAGAAVHYRRKAMAAVADAKPLQEGEEREENVARDSTAETATLAGKSMKQTSDASYP
jgi:lysylphosphatidylglycerol synthetase-like protein (DUF2156 family)